MNVGKRENNINSSLAMNFFKIHLPMVTYSRYMIKVPLSVAIDKNLMYYLLSVALGCIACFLPDFH